MLKGEKLTPLSLAEPPSGVLDAGKKPPYDPRRQYGVDRRTFYTTPTMGGPTTQTFDSSGKPRDSDVD